MTSGTNLEPVEDPEEYEPTPESLDAEEYDPDVDVDEPVREAEPADVAEQVAEVPQDEDEAGEEPDDGDLA